MMASPKKPMKIVMFGTGPFAVPTFIALLDSEYPVLALVTRPIDDAGKRRKTSANPMRETAESRALTVLDPTNANDPQFIKHLRQLQADLFVVCDYGQILSDDCLGAARLGGINLHGSLLPRYRGAAPVHWAIYHGEETTGVTVIHMTRTLDGGPILATASLSIDAAETTEQLEPRLAELGVGPVMQAIEVLSGWDGAAPLGQRQDPRAACSARRLRKDDGRIDWTRSAAQIVNQIRAFQPWPGTFTQWQRDPDKAALRLIVNAASPASSDALGPVLEPGQITVADSGRLSVQTGEGQLSLQWLQPAGKKVMPVEAFLRGYPVQVGDRLS